MGIEEDILQQHFRSPQQKGLINILFTYNWLNEKIRTILAHGNITGQQYNILRILKGAKKPLSTLQIRQRLLDKASDTSRIVDRLVIKELVTKTTCPMDKRLVDVAITDKGLALLDQLSYYNDEMDNLLGNLTEEELNTLNFLLDKIRQKKS
jgi:DNA-binding MarR family transcriptional regulator